MAVNPAFDQVLQQMRDLHQRKNHDYAADANPFSNFEEAAAFAGTDVDTVFRVMIGIKVARLKELQGKGKTPNNESIEDSQMDLVMYGALQRAYRLGLKQSSHTLVTAKFTAQEKSAYARQTTSWCAPGASRGNSTLSRRRIGI